MSGFRGVTFGGENVTPKNDGGLYGSHFGDGILWGCAESISGTDFLIQPGQIIAGGRVIEVDGATPVDLSGITINNGYVQIILNINLSNNPVVYTTWVEQGGLPFASLTQEDINYNGNLYQIQLGIVQVSGGTLSVYAYALPSNLTADNYLTLGSSNEMLVFNDGTDTGIVRRVSNSNRGGLTLPQTGADAILYGDGNNIFVRPNGVGDDSSRSTFYANGDFRIQGQMLGGTTTLTGNALVSSVTGNTVVARVNSGLDANARYIVFGYFGGTPSSANSGSTDMAIDVDGTAYRVTSIYSNAAVAKYQTMCVWVLGASSKIELRVWTSSQYNWNNIVANLQVVRIA